MNKLENIKLLLIITALLLVMKPFMGFSMVDQLVHIKRSDNIIVKVFSKRKPEFLDDATIQKRVVVNLLANPPLQALLSICSLIALFFSVLLCSPNTTQRFIQQLRLGLLPPHRTYLLTGKLII